MIPVFAVLFWPVGLLTGLRNVLWYAHGATPRMLKLAHRLVHRVVSSTPQGFRLTSDKVNFIGQGIDATRYQLVPRVADAKLNILTVGRLAPSKGLDLIVSALADWKSTPDWHLTIIGDGTSEAEYRYATILRQQARDTLCADRVTFTGRLDPDAIVPFLAKAAVFINMSSTGSLDKAIVEAMASGCPVVSSNDAFRAIAVAEGFPECAIDHSPQALRTALERLLGMSAAEREALGRRQAEVARRDHTLDGLIRRLYDILAASARGRE
jgi:glycosyltransferase involved in cell wall biosynthesis